LKKFYPQR